MLSLFALNFGYVLLKISIALLGERTAFDKYRHRRVSAFSEVGVIKVLGSS